ncbi:MAG: YicC family protein, partial [Treponema sp.]|nr:YicC family protein [Treponema sp.]
MRSMTGYACEERREEQYHLSVELRGYNNRFLEINFFLPPCFSPLEQRIRESIASVCVRGRVDVIVHYHDHQNAPFTVTLNHGAVRAYTAAFNSLAEILRVDEKPDLKTLIGLEGVLEVEWLR